MTIGVKETYIKKYNNYNIVGICDIKQQLKTRVSMQ